MKKYTKQEIVETVPGTLVITLPDNWFDGVRRDQSVFQSLYFWMLRTKRVPSDDWESLHNRTYAGEKLFEKLFLAEKERLQATLGLKGKELKEAVGWSDLNSGPRNKINGCTIEGDAAFVFPSSRMPIWDYFLPEN